MRTRGGPTARGFLGTLGVALCVLAIGAGVWRWLGLDLAVVGRVLGRPLGLGGVPRLLMGGEVVRGL